ncbi:hypothetical protein ANN_15407 [Periplaneta americana]|uniref:Uncharacterized protein n=1 Tax=Periplaneta americana TaxID=6978 RepID=A0ABQ8SGB7_PERAM|nr:hypothetical protein ANN_15407 [Periplaneta americana]
MAGLCEGDNEPTGSLKAICNPCKLVCKSDNGVVAVLKKSVTDGTVCFRGIRDICIGGVCRTLQALTNKTCSDIEGLLFILVNKIERMSIGRHSENSYLRLAESYRMTSYVLASNSLLPKITNTGERSSPAHKLDLQEIPCDLDFESEAVEDRCGVCHGDGGSCNITDGTMFFQEDKTVNCPKTGLNLTSDTKKTPLMRQLGQEIMG